MQGAWVPLLLTLKVAGWSTGLNLLLGVGAVAAHLSPRLLGQPTQIGLVASAQLGVPVAAATIGTQLRVLQPGESAALILGALVTIAVTTAGGALAVRAGLVGAREHAKDAPVA